jgi:hypothetical protein
MRRRGARYGLATICGGMGQGAATILESRPDGRLRSVFSVERQRTLYLARSR